MGFASLRVEPFSHRDPIDGIALLPEFWNKGYGMEVTKLIVDDNQGGIAMYEKIGFLEEGTKRKASWIMGRWEDQVFMGILDNEWEALELKSEAQHSRQSV
ncbi:gnat family [Moniliophthora roreri MCA 2997]|uniref:Gnat family n=2 Tax=Moniliophthora roreri TaxID=221103 RepID=V2X732_MONRO|nr:gnat family [Moniliophthora roreri MCA 2997]